ncbi:MAG: CpaF family protein, partial [Alphaproteobacteria bacterium]|nr:CpaF family protein [Alphaproteobacteria bacterium]
MFGKRTGQPGTTAAPARPAPAAASPAPLQPEPGVQTQAFAFGGDVAELEREERRTESYNAKPPSEAADRLDALAMRPRPAAAAAPANSSGPKATPGFEQLKKAQAVAEIVREQSDYYHATKTTIFNALMNTIDLAQLAGLDPKAAAEEIRD